MVALATLRIDANAVGYIDEWSDEAGGAVAAADVTTDTSFATYIDSNSAANVRQAFTIDTTFVEKFAFVQEVRVHARHKSDGSGSGTSLSQKVLVRINATNTEGTAFNSTGTASVYSEALARPGGGDWTEDDFRLTGANAFNFGVFHPSQTPEDCFVDELWVEVDYIPLGRTVDHEREVASRKLLLEREPEPLIKVIGGWDHAAAELMDFVSISHARGPSYNQAGWGAANWQRAFGRYKKQNIDLLNPRIESITGDRRRYQATFWELMAAVVASDPDVADGLARLDSAGAEREFTRSSKAWVEQVGGLVDEVNEAKEKIEPTGTLLEEARTNLALQSSFVNGTTGWTKNDVSGSGSTFSQDTDTVLFDTGVSPGSGKIAAPSGAFEITLESPSSESLSASTAYTVSVDWLGTDEMLLGIQNDTTANWLQSNGTWGASFGSVIQAGVTSIPNRGQFAFTTEGTASAHTIRVRMLSTGGPETYYVFHTQIEAGTFATSRIVTETASVTRAEDDLRIDNSSSLAQRIWPVDKFTCKIVFTPEWDSTDPTAVTPLLQLFHDSNNSVQVFHDTTPQLVFRYRQSGTNHDAIYASPSLSKNTEYTIVARKTSGDGELDLTADTITIFLDGVAGGTTTQTSADLTEAADGELAIGRNQSLPLNGWIKEIKVSPVVFSDEEIAAGL